MGVRPLFIVFEGIDGSGKTLQAAMLASRFQRGRIACLLTAEPSDGPLGRRLRSLTHHLSPEEEARLFTEDRKDHVGRVIMPALTAGQTVICDRYLYSSVAYQGARGVDISRILQENLPFARPADLTFILDVPVDIALMRIRSNRSLNLSPFENYRDLEGVHAVYQALKDPSIRRIDGTLTREEVHRIIVQILREHTGCTSFLRK